MCLVSADLEPRTALLTMLPDEPALLEEQDDDMGAASVNATLEEAHVKNSANTTGKGQVLLIILREYT